MTLISRSRIRPSKLGNITLSPEEIRRMNEFFGGFLQNQKILEQNLAKWKKKYPDRWVVVSGGKLVGYGKNRNALYTRLGKKGISLNNAAVKFLGTRRRTLILTKVN